MKRAALLIVFAVLAFAPAAKADVYAWVRVWSYNSGDRYYSPPPRHIHVYQFRSHDAYAPGVRGTFIVNARYGRDYYGPCVFRGSVNFGPPSVRGR